MPLYRTWAVTFKHESLSLPYSLSLIITLAVTSSLWVHSFPFVMRSGPTLPSALSHLACPQLLSALLFVCLVIGDDQQS